MIARLNGIVVSIDDGSIVLDISGVGYKVYITKYCKSLLKENQKLILWTYLSVREDAMDIYGFIEKEECKFFKMLVSISGIGPKSALGILSLAKPSTIIKAISTGNTSYLTKVSGIGKKNAEKIILELKDKIDDTNIGSQKMEEDSDVIDALISLGYTKNEARDAIKNIPSSVKGTNDRIKSSLKILSS